VHLYSSWGSPVQVIGLSGQWFNEDRGLAAIPPNTAAWPQIRLNKITCYAGWMRLPGSMQQQMMVRRVDWKKTGSDWVLTLDESRLQTLCLKTGICIPGGP